jgi:hypothetical protein
MGMKTLHLTQMFLHTTWHIDTLTYNVHKYISWIKEDILILFFWLFNLVMVAKFDALLMNLKDSRWMCIQFSHQNNYNEHGSNQLLLKKLQL